MNVIEFYRYTGTYYTVEGVNRCKIIRRFIPDNLTMVEFCDNRTRVWVNHDHLERLSLKPIS
jgi:hypothetical protein